MRRRTFLARTLTGAGAALAGARSAPSRAVEQAPAADPVDLALVMAIDGSASISGNTLEFQLRGHAGALRDPMLVDAITGGRHGAIRAAVAVWSDPGTFRVVVPWTRIAGPYEAVALADAIDAAPRQARRGATAIGSAVLAAVDLVAGVDAPRRTVDLTSNGFSNAGPAPEAARAAAEAAGVTVNALAILNEFSWLEDYYRANVIAGPGAFVTSVADFDGFEDALRAKLIAEIV
jgi:hypothetical protein